jgi:lipopolysaccharide/colanic/teichoic acid biosynthesis glycosyltransferase
MNLMNPSLLVALAMLKLLLQQVKLMLVQGDYRQTELRPRREPLLHMIGSIRARLPSLRWAPSLKAASDFALALILLLLATPVLLVVALLVKLTSRGPVLYRQTRLGLQGRSYTLYKIRTMIDKCENATGPQWATPCDPRTTWVGRVLRRTHIDELPQLWNVLRGDMSLVGPRPERPEFVAFLEPAIPCYRQRLAVRPGLSGLAQIQLPADIDLDSVRRKLAYDLYYVHRLSFWLDVLLMLNTACYLVGIPFAWSRRLFRVPCGEPVERHYQALAAESDFTPPALPGRPAPRPAVEQPAIPLEQN